MRFSSSPPRGPCSVSHKVPSDAKAKPSGLRMPVGPDFRAHAGLVEEGIVGRGRAVGREMDDLADIDIQLLRQLLVIVGLPVAVAVAHGHEQAAVLGEGDAAALLHGEICFRQFRHAAIDHGDVVQRIAGFIQHAIAPDRCCCCPWAEAGRRRNRPCGFCGNPAPATTSSNPRFLGRRQLVKPVIGSDSVPSALTMRRWAGNFSLTSILPSGRKASDQGRCSLSVTVVTL